MLRKSVYMLSGLALLFTLFVTSEARSILEKKIFYINDSLKTGEARFWAIYLGNYDCTLNRNVPGSGTKKINASMNIQMVSSGYIEGNGYGSTGKVESLPVMMFRDASNNEKTITIDSIDFIFDYGQQVKLLSGETGTLVMDIEGTKVIPKKFLLREYKLVDYYGEEVLRDESEEKQISAFSFSKEGLQRLLAHLKSGAGK